MRRNQERICSSLNWRGSASPSSQILVCISKKLAEKGMYFWLIVSVAYMIGFEWLLQKSMTETLDLQEPRSLGHQFQLLHLCHLSVCQGSSDVIKDRCVNTLAFLPSIRSFNLDSQHQSKKMTFAEHQFNKDPYLEYHIYLPRSGYCLISDKLSKFHLRKWTDNYVLSPGKTVSACPISIFTPV